MSGNQTGSDGDANRDTAAGNAPPAEYSEQDSNIYDMARAKHNADIHRQVAKLRSKGMRHRNRASKFLLKSKKAEKRAAAMLHKATQLRQEATAIQEQAKTKGKAAADIRNSPAGSNGQATTKPMSKSDDREMKITRLEHEEAKLQKQANSYLSKAASLTEKATRLKQKSIVYLQKQRTHEVNSAHYMKRAEDLERSQN
jgi:ribonuclease D